MTRFTQGERKKRMTLLMLVLAAGLGRTAVGLCGEDVYKPTINPADFSDKIDNPYYPLVPGTILKYEETTGGKTQVNEITVTHDTKAIMGVKCRVVHDVVKQDGAILEDTYDWLAQHKDGTVWYFGEDTKETKPGGVVTTIGSWESGVNGAQPGILMPGRPKPGAPYRQEYGRGVAEDMGQIVALGEKVTVPAGTYTDTVKTKDWSLLESGSENKWYARGVGVVKETNTDGDVATLISITHE